ncbi:MAG: hypothetical protein K8R45_00335, partial [Desulfobacterales bacterium]|nr:hypothetical protein [Desulfobacterales bacterium]
CLSARACAVYPSQSGKGRDEEGIITRELIWGMIPKDKGYGPSRLKKNRALGKDLKAVPGKMSKVKGWSHSHFELDNSVFK